MVVLFIYELLQRNTIVLSWGGESLDDLAMPKEKKLKKKKGYKEGEGEQEEGRSNKIRYYSRRTCTEKEPFLFHLDIGSIPCITKQHVMNTYIIGCKSS